MSDSEVSPEAELGKTSAKHPQVDCVKEAEKAEETLNEDEKESVDSNRGVDGEDEVMYDIDIDTDNENAEGSARDVRREDQIRWGGCEEARRDPDAPCMSGSVDEGHRIKQAEAPEEKQESHSESKVTFQLLVDGPALLCFSLWVLWWWWPHCCVKYFFSIFI